MAKVSMEFLVKEVRILPESNNPVPIFDENDAFTLQTIIDHLAHGRGSKSDTEKLNQLAVKMGATGIEGVDDYIKLYVGEPDRQTLVQGGLLLKRGIEFENFNPQLQQNYNVIALLMDEMLEVVEGRQHLVSNIPGENKGTNFATRQLGSVDILFEPQYSAC